MINRATVKLGTGAVGALAVLGGSWVLRAATMPDSAARAATDRTAIAKHAVAAATDGQLSRLRLMMCADTGGDADETTQQILTNGLKADSASYYFESGYPGGVFAEVFLLHGAAPTFRGVGVLLTATASRSWCIERFEANPPGRY